MIFTKIYIDNLFSFKEAELDLSIKKKVVNSTIPNEYLEGRENFRFRKVCILSGANASGKTSLGRILHEFKNAVVKKQFSVIDEMVTKYRYHDEESAVLELEFATPSTFRLHRIRFEYGNASIEEPTLLRYAYTSIGKNHSVATTRKALDAIWLGEKKANRNQFFVEYKESKESKAFSSLIKFFNLSVPVLALTKTVFEILSILSEEVDCDWYFLFSQNNPEKSQNLKTLPVTADLFYKVLSTFDSSIKQVMDSKDEDGLNGFTIKFGNGETIKIDLEGNPTNPERLSRGTFDAIQLVGFISFLLDKKKRERERAKCCTYFLDEKMAYAHSELEQAVVNVITEHLGRNSQFFYTTHNYDILDLNYPIHSYVFLKKKGEFVSFVQPEETFKKNDRGLLNYIKNDAFRTLPDVSKLEELLYE